MFERLLLADIVIADISIHNANVYYELGIRHALRPRTTILIRARRDDVPFDLSTDRYLAYDTADLAASREALTLAVQQSNVSGEADSPVFRLLPGLKAVDPDSFRPVPEGFGEAVREAVGEKDLPMLAVLAEEAQGFDWGAAGSELVGARAVPPRARGRTRGRHGRWSATCATTSDTEANLMLGTVLAADRRLRRPRRPRSSASSAPPRRSTTPARRGQGAAGPQRQGPLDRRLARTARTRAAAALRSPYLEEARSAYDEGFLDRPEPLVLRASTRSRCPS